MYRIRLETYLSLIVATPLHAALECSGSGLVTAGLQCQFLPVVISRCHLASGVLDVA